MDGGCEGGRVCVGECEESVGEKRVLAVTVCMSKCVSA